MIPACVQLCRRVPSGVIVRTASATASTLPIFQRQAGRVFTDGCSSASYHREQQQQLKQQKQWQRHEPLSITTCPVRMDGSAPTILSGISDRYGGVHVHLDQLPPDCHTRDFASVLQESLASWSTSERSSVWLSVPIEMSFLIPEAAKCGFSFHHAEDRLSVLCLWLRKDTFSLVPSFASHQVGVAGCVVNGSTNEVLVLKDKMQSHLLWKFPGGLSELGEDIEDAAKREVFEETGIRTNSHGILAFRQQHDHPDAYGRSDLFYVCLLTPMNYDLVPCKEEIAVCKWTTIDDLEQTMMTSAITKRAIQLVRFGLQNGFEKVLIRAEECKSIYKGKRMTLFSRSLDKSENFDLGNYSYHITKGDLFN